MKEIKPLVVEELNPPLNINVIKTDKDLYKVDDFLNRSSIVTYDVETNIVNNFFNRKIRTIQVGDRNEQYILDLLYLCNGAIEDSQGNYGSNASNLAFVEMLKPHLQNHDLTKVGHNLQFDYQTTRWSFGIKSTGFFDTYLAEKIIYAGLKHYLMKDFWALDDLVARYCGLKISKEEQTSFDLVTPLTYKQEVYIALDVRLPLAIRTAQIKFLEEHGLTWTAQIENDAISPFGEMHLEGVCIDKDKWLKILNDNIEKKKIIINEMDQKLIPAIGTKVIDPLAYEVLGMYEKSWRDCPSKTLEDKQKRVEHRTVFNNYRRELKNKEKYALECEGNALVNYGSPSKVLKALIDYGFTTKQLPDTNDRNLKILSKNKELTVSEAFVGSLNNLDVIDLLRLYRSLEKAIDNYGIDWVSSPEYDNNGKKISKGNVNPFTGKIHSNINQIGAATGRTSSDNPNVQNIPRDSESRECFVAPDGYVMITADYDGCELRILTEMSQEPAWVDAFNKGWDVHSVGAEIIFGDVWKKAAEADCAYYKNHKKCKCPLHKKLRNHIKNINFGIAYGIGSKKLAEDLGISNKESKDLLDEYKKVFSVLTNFLEKLGQNVSNTLTARTLTGRWRRWIRPTWDKAIEYATNDLKTKKINRLPTEEEKRKAYTGMFASIQREGKNTPIQGLNAEIVKRAMYLIFLEGDKYCVKLVLMVHDELVAIAPKENAEEAKNFVVQCMEKAGAEFVKSLKMPVDANVDICWRKG